MKIERVPVLAAAGLIPSRQVRLSDVRRVVGRINRAVQPTPIEIGAIQPEAVESRAEHEAAALRAEIDAQAVEVERLRELVIEREKAAFAKGFEAGEAKGRAFAVEGAQQRDRRLAEGLADASESLESTLQRIEGVASTLALAAVEEIVGDVADVKTRVQQVVRRQLGRLCDALPLRVRVSHEDFPDPGPIRRMLQDEGLEGVEILADASLESGACRIQVRLGEVDAGIRRQLDALASLLGVESHGND